MITRTIYIVLLLALMVAVGFGVIWSMHAAKIVFGDGVLGSIESLNPFGSQIKIVIGGDVMMDRKIRQYAEMNGYDSLFSEITSLFHSADISVVNLEGPITSNTSKTLLPSGQTTNELRFTFDPKSAKALKAAGVTAVSLANNHTDNFGISGLNETKKYLNEAGIKYFGSPWNEASSTWTFEKDGFSVAFVGYHQFQQGFENILADIKDLHNQGYLVIVVPHWGEEYNKAPTPLMIEERDQMISAGADAIVGSHPHVTIERDIVDRVPVFYSLGNLLFDQYFSKDVMVGNMIELTLKKTGNKQTISNIEVFETSMASRSRTEIIGTKEKIKLTD